MGDSDSLATILTVPLCPLSPSGSGPESSGPILPFRVMMSVWVAGFAAAISTDCAQTAQPSTRTVTTRADVQKILRSIGDLLLRRQFEPRKTITTIPADSTEKSFDYVNFLSSPRKPLVPPNRLIPFQIYS